MAGKVLVLAAAIAIAGLGAAADPAVYRGTAQVVGPAMLSLDGKRIGLFGVDAPVVPLADFLGLSIELGVVRTDLRPSATSRLLGIFLDSYLLPF
jgi:hypothetical protein